MPLKMILTLITLMTISACGTSPVKVQTQVIIPPKSYEGTVKKSSILKCPEDVRKEVYTELRKREQYIETLTDVMKAHNGEN